jgi:hypothetical protein
MPTVNLRKLVEAFDASEYPVLQLKLLSMRRGVEGTIALIQSHSEEVDWEKVGSSYARPPSEMKEFFKKANEYAPRLIPPMLPRQGVDQLLLCLHKAARWLLTTP